MATLTTKKRNALSDSDFAYIDSDGGRHLPIHDEGHVRAAMSRFNQTEFESDAKKAAARKKILAAAKTFGIDVTNFGGVGDVSGEPDAVAFSTDLQAGTSTADELVIRTGKIFECGDYEDREFSFDEDDLEHAVEAFRPCPVDLEHVPTVLAGKLGEVRRIFPGEDGTSVMGEVALPAWLDRLLSDGERRVSATWDRATKTLKGLALVRNPRVSDAALMAAFSAANPASHPAAAAASGGANGARADPAFARKRHDTPTGRMSIQRLHDVSVQEGAVCNQPTTAAMASRHEHSAIQQTHDLAVDHGARCEALGASPTGVSVMYSSQLRNSNPNPRPQKPDRRPRIMKFADWLKGKATEEGVEIEDLEAAFTAGASSDELDAVQQALTEKDAKIAALEAAQQAAAATFARMAEERRQTDAATFAAGLVTAKRITPGAAEKLAPLAARIAAADSTATFAEGEPPTLDLLKAFCESLPDLSVFTTEHVRPDAVAALFNLTETESVSRPKDVTQARKDELLKATPLGRAILAERATAGNGTNGAK